MSDHVHITCNQNECITTPCDDDRCEKPVLSSCDKDKCKSIGYGWGRIATIVLWFIIITILFWLIFYSLKPTFVLENGSNQVDTSKVLLAAIIATIIVMVLIWVIELAIAKFIRHH